MRKLFALFLLFFLTASFNQAEAQCKSYAKRKCRPALTPYLHNGQLNNAVLMPGDKAELMLTFYSGQAYRLMVCSMPILGEVSFKLMDSDRNVIHESKDATKDNIFDFKVASTQQLILEITVPENETANGLVVEGCVSILVGFKK